MKKSVNLFFIIVLTFFTAIYIGGVYAHILSNDIVGGMIAAATSYFMVMLVVHYYMYGGGDDGGYGG
jgi:hypothetical protein